MDLKLVNDASDPFDGDIAVENNDVSFVDGADGIAQHMQIRYRLFLGEWFLNTSLGVPWFRDVLVKPASLPVVQDVLKEVALETPGVIEITKFIFGFDSATREISLAINVFSDDGPIDFAQIVEVAA